MTDRTERPGTGTSGTATDVWDEPNPVAGGATMTQEGMEIPLPDSGADHPTGPRAELARAAMARGGTASQWRLVWRRFRRHKVAYVSIWIVLAIYLVMAFAEFLAPSTATAQDAEYAYAPPQALHISHPTEGFGLHVNGFTVTQNPDTFANEFEIDEDRHIPVGFFVRGEPYELWGVFPMDVHLIGPEDPDQPFYLWGADRAGRDSLSRILYGSRVSLSIGLVGVAISLVLGIALGGISGYYGGKPDTLIQRIIEFLMAIPTLPLWLALSAAIPASWGPLARYFAITAILSVIGWTGMARQVRGKFLSLREEDFITAASLDGCNKPRIIFRHMVPSFSSHVIASLTMAVPGMILAETSLSFLGLGLQAPAVSWGVLLQDAQNIRTIETAPWLLLPGLAIFITVLAMNFVGDGLRDAADPYK
ncbi:ABC transporter permease [Occultella aeris]|uniref:Oligopeptide transport system permease protein OppC n=1 Tax=Occultella aeris TaxID=2761496 RepID=A0A7M4DHX8_9MICO|nr:ABC transporter permease [Occultella aeris]VZO36525.1 Oligopeptide transport system permease protein OppC [Occultella aeris]